MFFGAGILTFLVKLKEIGTFCTQKCSYINFFSAKSAPQSARSAESGSLKHLPKATLELLPALSVKSRTMASELSPKTKLSADEYLAGFATWRGTTLLVCKVVEKAFYLIFLCWYITFFGAVCLNQHILHKKCAGM